MGVLACNRHSCEKVMCDRYSRKYGYICYECFDELVKLGAFKDIQEFMNTPKVEENIYSPSAFEVFDHIFPWKTEEI